MLNNRKRLKMVYRLSALKWADSIYASIPIFHIELV